MGERGGLTEDRGDLVEVGVGCHLLLQVGILIRWFGYLGRCVGTNNCATNCFFVVVAFWDICTVNYNDVYIPLIMLRC